MADRIDEDVLRILLLCLALSAGAASAHQVIGIADGDTLTVLRNRKPLKVRLADIDAPEKRQPFGTRSKEALAELCFGKEATLRTRSKDRYGRVVARVQCGGVDASRAQVERGMAWHYRRYSKDKTLAFVQDDARQARRGLWADRAPVPPWQFRRQ